MSGPAFGRSTVQINDATFHYHYDQWIQKVNTKEESSNWRELTNLVVFVKDLVEEGEYEGFELFIFMEH